MLSSKLTPLTLKLRLVSLSFLFLFLHTCCFSPPPSSCLVSWSPVVWFPSPPTLSPLSVHPSLPAALRQQSVMGLGCRWTVKAPPRPSSSSSAPLHPCCPLPKVSAQSIFTQVMRRAATQRRVFPQGNQTLIRFLFKMFFFKNQLTVSSGFIVFQFLTKYYFFFSNEKNILYCF